MPTDTETDTASKFIWKPRSQAAEELPSRANVNTVQAAPAPPPPIVTPLQESSAPIDIPVGQLNVDQQHAVEQFRAITEGIKECPAGVNPETNTLTGSRFSAPMNVIWDVERTNSYRSPLIGYIEFISDSTYPLSKLVQCKKGDRKCMAWNQAIAEANMMISALPTRRLYRYEFDFGVSGLEFGRALWKDGAGASHWQPEQLGNGCIDQTVKKVLAAHETQQSDPVEDAKQAMAFYEGNDYIDARPLLDKACNSGNAEACEDLGYIYDAGLGIAENQSRAVTLYTKACDAGNVDGCLSLGVSYGNGQGVERDYSRARELYSKSCDKGNSLGCAYLGDIYRNGYGVVSDYKGAVILYAKSCATGEEYGYGCAALGEMYQNGFGVSKDTERAKELYRKSCRLGSENGCNLLKSVQ